jgi:hypothetical protein
MVTRVGKSSPWLMAGLVVLNVLPMHQLMGLPIMLLSVIVNCRLVRAAASELDGEAWKPSREDYTKTFVPALASNVLFSIALWIGLAIFIVPGLLVALFCCLSLAAVCLDNVRPLESFNRSWALTHKRAWLLARYMAIPSLLLVIPIVVPFLIWPLLAITTGLARQPWVAGNMVGLAFALMGTCAFLSTLAGFVFIPMQVKLYRKLTRESGLSPAATMTIDDSERKPGGAIAVNDSVTRTDL